MSKVPNSIRNNSLAKYAATLSITEIGIGGFMHALKLPLTGQLLSLNQIFILSHASLKIKNKSTPAMISMVSALLKSLAPAGKKLTPMLAIASQGHLFSLGLWIFGVNLLGRLIGAVLSSLWAYIQPLCLYLILFGKDFIFIYDYFFKKISKLLDISHDNFIYILLSIIALKVILAVTLVLISYKISDEQIDKLQNWASNYKKSAPQKQKLHPLLGAIKDLLNPLFIISMILTFLFFYYARSSQAELIWVLMRPMGLGFLIFFLLRVMPIENLISRMKEGKYKSLLEETIYYIKK